MRSLLIVALVFLTACVSEPLPDGFKDSNDFDPVVAAKNRISLGLTYLQNGDFSQAKYNLDKALQFAPRLADAHYSMAYYYQQVDEIELADKAYQKALDFAPKNADIANSYGAFLCENGDYKQAKKYFLKAVNSSNYISTAETYENLALCSQSQGQLDDAITYLQSAINHQPSRGKSILLLVELQMQQQQWQDAKLNLRRYEKVARITPDTLLKSIEIENALNNTALAKGYGDMLIRMYPTDPRTLQYLKERRGVSNVDASGKISRQLKPDTDVIAQSESTSAITTETQQLKAPVQANSDDTSESAPVVIVATADQAPRADEVEQPIIIETTDKPVVVITQPALTSNTEQADSSASTVSLNNEQEKMPEPTSQSDAESPRYHVVAKGENLYRISLRYNVKMKRLMEWNELQEGDAVVIGTRLLVVDPATVE
ncbi:type IV pilus biogenesis/stability protein PilW [Aliiglaciecola litoralis]